jgi:hypothetical protein
MKRFVSVFVMVALAGMLIGCGKSTVGPAVKAITLPSTASMEIPDLDAGGNAKVSKSESRIAVTYAYAAVAFWTSAVRGALVTPVALFKLTHTATPTPLDDNSGWKWTVGNATYSATLIGRIENDSVKWSMTVNGPNLTNFTWYTGTSTITGESGSWSFYDTTAGNPEAVRFAYQIGSANSSIRVDFVKPSQPGTGSYLAWAVAGSQKSFEIFGAENNENFLISWNALTGEGSVDVENVTTSAQWCWDTKANNYQDIPCN